MKLLSVKNLSVYHKLKKDSIFASSKKMQAVRNVSFDLEAGQVLGVVGESGCGKSTLARAITGLNPLMDGEILYNGENLVGKNQKDWMKVRKDIQMIFQDPLASLNPRMNVGEILKEPLKIHFPKLSNSEIRTRIIEMVKKVGLLESQINSYPHELSGGQCQRVSIARALIIQPKLLICDEPVSALDVSIQSQIVNLLKDLQSETNMSLIFIAHDLSVVKHMSDFVMVMYLGNAVEIAKTNDIYKNNRHPYTKALIDSVPMPDPILQRTRKIALLQGDLPSPINPPAGCAFHTRCVNAKAECASKRPLLEVQNNKDHLAACFYPNA